jgi:spore germination protein GerM
MMDLRRCAYHVALPILLALAALAFAACGATGGSSTVPSATPVSSQVTAPSPTTSAPTSSAASQSASSTASIPTTRPATLLISLYFMRGQFIGTSQRTIPWTQATATAALRALLAGPNSTEKAAGLTTAIPAGTDLRGVVVRDGLATVDLTKAYESGGGTLSMTARLAQVVYTLTQFPTVHGVTFKVEGEAVRVFGGEGIVLDHPQKRSDYESVTPPIFVDTPAVGDTVRSPLRLRGTANVFEAVFQARLVASNGTVIAKRRVTATAGSGTRGTFDVTVPFSTAATTGKLVVYEISAKDGSPVNVVRIPLRFAH